MAGNGLLKECAKLGGCKTGQAKITGGYNLKVKYVIHTVGPIYWQYSPEKSKELLTSCYKNSLELALENGCKSVAFPLVSAGVYGYPKEEALQVAVETISAFNIDATIVLFDHEAYEIAKNHFSAICF